MPTKKVSRAYLAGLDTTKAIIEMVNLMYQKRTARNFMRGLMRELNSTIWVLDEEDRKFFEGMGKKKNEYRKTH